MLPVLRGRFGVPVGFSGHETRLPSRIAAVAMGACMVKLHITLDRAMRGTDQTASREPNGINKLVSYIRVGEKSMGDGVKRVLEWNGGSRGRAPSISCNHSRASAIGATIFKADSD